MVSAARASMAIRLCVRYGMGVGMGMVWNHFMLTHIHVHKYVTRHEVA